MRQLGLALPPQRMPLRAGTRPLKRWRYVGVYTPEVMLCVGEARVGPLPLRWWAVALPDGSLFERTTNVRGGIRLEGSRVSVIARHVRIELELEERGAVETVSPAGASYAWTRKQAAVPVCGRVDPRRARATHLRSSRRCRRLRRLSPAPHELEVVGRRWAHR